MIIKKKAFDLNLFHCEIERLTDAINTKNETDIDDVIDQLKTSIIEKMQKGFLGYIFV